MSIIFVLIPLAVIIVAIAIGVFFWAVKSNQFDDLERQGYSILFDDDITPNNTKDNKTVSDKAESSETVESDKQNTKEPKH